MCALRFLLSGVGYVVQLSPSGVASSVVPRLWIGIFKVVVRSTMWATCGMGGVLCLSVC